jgi:hypothetical protein
VELVALVAVAQDRGQQQARLEQQTLAVAVAAADMLRLTAMQAAQAAPVLLF